MTKIRICMFVMSVVFITALPAQEGTGSKEFTLGIGFPVMIPVGDLRDMVSLSVGSSLEARFSGLIAPVELRLRAAYYYLCSTCNITTSYQALSAALYGGYPLSLHRRIRLTPLVGIGVLYNMVEDIFYENRGYADMYITTGAGLDFYLLERLSVNVFPEYTVFFEQDCCGMFLNIGLGASYHF